MRVPPEDFHPALREACDRVGALLIHDEVMTGLGRTGSDSVELGAAAMLMASELGLALAA